ncbi:hypothetical protein [Pacificoceanicola onchidii]|nr:hypothetical protein [Pacificoceanicola onchidii]
MKTPMLTVNVKIAAWVVIPDALFELLIDERVFDLLGMISEWLA